MSVVGAGPNLGASSLLARSANEDAAIHAADRVKGDKEQIKDLANQFESLFLNMVMKSMRDTVQKSGLVDGGNAEDIYKGMLDDEYTKMMAEQRHTGIAQNIEDFLMKAYDDSEPAMLAKKTAELAKTQGLKAYQGAGWTGGEKSATMNADRPTATLHPRAI